MSIQIVSFSIGDGGGMSMGGKIVEFRNSIRGSLEA
jgi:hypothetical protein